MAGYKDRSRPYVGVYSVSYMLKKAFSKAKDVQFILVVDNASLFLNLIEELIKPFINFIEMFKRQYLLEN